MKYMQKKGEDFPIPYDATLYDPEVYEMLEPAAEPAPAKPKRSKPKAAPVAEQEPEAEAPADDDDFDLGDLDA